MRIAVIVKGSLFKKFDACIEKSPGSAFFFWNKSFRFILTLITDPMQASYPVIQQKPP